MRAFYFLLFLLCLNLMSTTVCAQNKNLTLKDLKKALFKFDGIGEGGPEALYLSEHKKPAKDDNFAENLFLCDYAFGDINGDGLGDAVAIVALNTGGTSQFTYIDAFINKGGYAQCVDWISLGDRSRSNSMKIVKGKIICDLNTHAPSDGANCPSLRRILKYKLVKNKLIGPHDVQ